MIKKIIPIFLSFLLVGCASSGPNQIIKPENRKTAPTLFGQTLDGKSYQMQTGRVTVINVWASWCGPCRAETPILVDFAEKNPNIQFIGIVTRDNISAAQAFARKFKINYPTYVDDALINKFQGSIPANGIPTTLILDEKNRVAARISGAMTVANFKQVLENISGTSINA